MRNSRLRNTIKAGELFDFLCVYAEMKHIWVVFGHEDLRLIGLSLVLGVFNVLS